MEKGKQLLALVLAMVLLAGCGEKNDDSGSTSQAQGETPQASLSTVQQTETQAPDGIEPLTGLSARFPGQRAVAVML
ncbi:hypothetical protein EVA_18873, partial [gut metagenome]